LVSTDVNGRRFYVDFDHIHTKSKRSVFYWQLSDYAKPAKTGTLSVKSFEEVDCGIPRKLRILAINFYPQPMAQGDLRKMINKPTEWLYPQPGTSGETVLKTVCPLAEKK